MTKVYLLLRNNKQTGPHTLEELLKLGIKPLDLIWIEGKSFGWSYPSEINALKPYVPVSEETNQQNIAEKKSPGNASQQISNEAYQPIASPVSKSADIPPARKVYVSMPSNVARPVEAKKEVIDTNVENTSGTIEQKAEALRKKLQSHVPENNPVAITPVPVTTNYSTTIPEREEEYTSWIYNQKTSKSRKINEAQKKLAAAIVAVLLILGIGFGISLYHNDTKKEVALITPTEISNTDKTAPIPLIPEPEPTVTPSTQPITENITKEDVSNAPVKKIVKTSPPENKTIQQTHKSVLVTPSQKTVAFKTPEKEPINKNIAETKPVNVSNPVKKETAAVVEVPKKKKTLNEKVDAFFSKFSRKKTEAPVVDQPATNTISSSPAGNSFPGTVERKAVHRDDKVVASSPAPVTKSTIPESKPDNTNLADFVQVSSTKPAENWMLGVHGLKVSLHNSGNETVKAAEVEMRYYTEQNEVLDKKIVNFSNIQPGKTVTLPAPDHRLADHADFRLVNAK